MTDYGIAGIIYTSLQTALLASTRYWLYQDNLRVKAKIMYVVLFLLAAISATIWLTLGQYFHIRYSVYRIIVASLFFALSCCIINEPFAKHAFSYAFIMAYDATFEATASFVQSRFAVTTSPYIYIATASIILILTFIPAVRSLKKITVDLAKLENDKLWGSLCVICYSFLFMNLIFTFPPQEKPTVIALVSRYLMCAGMCAIYYAATRVMQTMRDSVEMKADLSLTKRQIEAQQRYYDRLVSQMDEVRRMRHDLHHHNAALQALIKDGDTVALSAYIKDIDATDNPVPISGNLAVDSLLMYYADEAKAQKVKFETDCVFSAPSKITDADMCVIVGNLLENALDAQKYIAEELRFVSVLSRCDAKGFTLAVDNRFDGTLLQENGVNYSRKETGRKGIGLQSVTTLCEKYDGIFKIETDNDIFKAGVVIGT